jgi:hypothetical protein
MFALLNLNPIELLFLLAIVVGLVALIFGIKPFGRSRVRLGALEEENHRLWRQQRLDELHEENRQLREENSRLREAQIRPK